MNPIAAHLMTPTERRAALCSLLALGLLRLHMPKQANYMTGFEKVRFTSAPNTSLMQLQPTGDPHDNT